MAVRRITIPGTSGNALSTADINLLPSDDAHGHQAIGGWTASGTNTIVTVTDTDDSLVHPFFTQGGFTKVFKVTYQDNLDLADLTLPTLTAAGHIFICSVWLPSNWDGGDIDIDDNGTYGSETGVSNQDGASGTTETWQTVWRKFTPDAGDLAGTLTIATDSAPTAGRVMYFAFNTVRADQVETQVASIRFVNTVDVEASVALDDYASGANQFILNIDNVSDNTLWIGFAGSADRLWIRYGDRTALQVLTVTDGNRYEFQFTCTLAGALLMYQDGVQVHSSALGAVTVGPPGTLVVGAAATSLGWMTGDMHWVTLRDDIGGPVCSRTDAQDAWLASGYNGLSDTDTWIGKTDGRTWTAHGSSLLLPSLNLEHRNIAGPGQMLRTG